MLTYAQKKSKIEILNADEFKYDETLGKKARKLIGAVKFKHDEVVMFCDSAYFYSDKNSMRAFSNVRILQNDSLQIFSDFLDYDGNTKKAKLRGNVRLNNKDIVLTTKFLDYDKKNNILHYYDGGTVITKDEESTLSSKHGYYYTQSKTFYFKEDVTLTNADYNIESDTLQYNSNSEIVTFLGPSTITSDSNYIYTENGWYDTKRNISTFYKNSYLFAEGKRIEGDTLYYERDNGLGRILGNAFIQDTAENIVLRGNVVHFFEKNDSVMVTQQALLEQMFDDDTLFMHADTFKISTQIVPQENFIDTIRTLYAYNGVKFFKSDMQGKADSVMYSFKDSVINFYNEPVIWSDESQITADFIYIKVVNNSPYAIYMQENAFISSKADSNLMVFDQIRGENMVGHFKDSKLHKIHVMEDSETIYYAKDEDENFIGVNKAEGENMLIFIENNTLTSLTFIKDPEATLYPVNNLSEKVLKLTGFTWQVEERPLTKEDIFK
ncbi:organic solvent tolerance protein OstA [bacterium]|nr:organic solvent tolerance protein OstA [bacterium]